MMISQLARGRVDQGAPSGMDHRAPAPSLPAWRVALYAALIAVEMLSLFALLYLMEPAP